MDPLRARALAALRIEIAVRGGRFTEAFERASATPGAVSALVHAELTLASGDPASARRALIGLASPGGTTDASERVRAFAALAELDLLAGKPDVATAQLAASGELLAHADPLSRARVHLASARLDEYSGRVAAMRSALARAHGACKSVPACLEALELSAIIDARRAIGLAREGRLVEAASSLDAAHSAARDLDAVAVSDEVLAARALVARRRGDSTLAAQLLHDLVRARRERGDELGALRAELDLAELEILRGQPSLAAELAQAALASSVRRELGHLAARGAAVVAAIDLMELRLDAALPRLEELHGQLALDAASAATVAVLLATARATSGQRAGAVDLAYNAGAESRDELDRKLAAAEVSLAAGDVGGALELARETAVLAERGHRTIELASALVIVARLELARGDRGNARAAATRAAREAAAAGLVRARVHALLALAALSRDDDDSASAVSYARDAAELALAAGLPVERLVAHAALDAISGHEAVADPSAPSAATMAPTAIDGAARLLTDLGLTAQRPFRVIDAEGVPSDVADANPEVLRLPARALAVDGVREVIGATARSSRIFAGARCSSACCSCSPPRRIACSARRRSCRRCGTSSTTRCATTRRCSRTSCASAASSAKTARDHPRHRGRLSLRPAARLLVRHSALTSSRSSTLRTTFVPPCSNATCTPSSSSDNTRPTPHSRRRVWRTSHGFGGLAGVTAGATSGAGSRPRFRERRVGIGAELTAAHVEARQPHAGGREPGHAVAREVAVQHEVRHAGEQRARPARRPRG